jgi:DNA-binding CsgD family transcriptional regulator
LNNFISLSDDFGLINRILSQVPGYIAFQDLKARFLCANDLIISAMGFDNLQQLIGLYPGEVRCPAAELEDQIIANMAYVIEQNRPVNTLFSAYLADRKWGLYIGQQQPLRDYAGTTIGIATHTFEITDTPLSYSLIQFFLEQKGKGTPKLRQGVYKYMDCRHEWNLSPRQGECFFWVLQRKSAREIGLLLGLSKRTIEHYIDLIKAKFKVKTMPALLELAQEKGMINFIPQHWSIYPGETLAIK